MPRTRKAMPHVRMSLPMTFTDSSEQILGSLVIERLQRIFPETETTEAIGYLVDASLALSLSRSYQGIVTSASKDLIPSFDLALQGHMSEEKMDVLEGILKAEMVSSLGDLGLNRKAQRVKGAFHLLNAAELRRHSLHASTA